MQPDHQQIDRSPTPTPPLSPQHAEETERDDEAPAQLDADEFWRRLGL